MNNDKKPLRCGAGASPGGSGAAFCCAGAGAVGVEGGPDKFKIDEPPWDVDAAGAGGPDSFRIDEPWEGPGA